MVFINKQHSFLIVVSCLIVGSLVTGCGPGGSGSSTTNSTTSTTAPTAGGTGNNSQDSTINSTAQAAIAADPALKNSSIQLSTAGAQVTLAGNVATVKLKNDAEKDVMSSLSKYSSVNPGVIDTISVGPSK